MELIDLDSVGYFEFLLFLVKVFVFFIRYCIGKSWIGGRFRYYLNICLFFSCSMFIYFKVGGNGIL